MAGVAAAALSTAGKSVEAAMGALLSGDDAIRKPAEAFLKAFLKQPAAAGGLLEVMANSTAPAARQMAGLFLRRKVHTYWLRLNAAQQNAIKAVVLERLQKEPIRVIRIALVSVAAAMAHHLVPNKQWNELFAFINQCARHEHPDYRELAMLLFKELIEVVGRHLQSEFGALKVLFANGMKDPQSAKVRYGSLRALARLMRTLSTKEQAKAFQDLILPMLVVTQEALKSGDDDVAVDALDSVAELAESGVPVLKPFLKELICFMLPVVSNPDYAMGVRDCAGNVIISTLIKRPKATRKKGLVPDILKTGLSLVAQFDPDDHSDHRWIIRGDGTVSGIGERIVDTLANTVPSKYVMPPLTATIVPALKAADYRHRRAALVTLSMIAEGYADRMRENLATLIPLVLPLVKDPNWIVRESWCWLLGQWGEHLRPDVFDHHATLMPAVFALLDDPQERVQEKACYILETYTEHLDPEHLATYIDPLMKRLGKLVLLPNVQVQEMAVSAISSVAIAGGARITPYFEPIAKLLSEFMDISDEPRHELRGYATSAAGLLGQAVGKELFCKQYCDIFVRKAAAGLQLGSASVTENTFNFFASLAVILKDDFKPLIDRLMVPLMDAMRMDDGAFTNVVKDDSGGMDKHIDMVLAGDDEEEEEEEEDAGAQLASGTTFGVSGGAGGGAGAAEDSDGSDEDEYGADELYVGATVTMQIQTSFLRVKEEAATAIAAIAEHLGADLEDWLGDCIGVMLDNLSYFHEDIRRVVVSALKHLLVAAFKVLPPKQTSSGLPEISPDLASALDTITFQLIQRAVCDHDKETVARICDSLAFWCETLGVVAIDKQKDNVHKMVKTLLKEQGGCQHYEEDEEGDEDGEHDLVLMDAVADLVETLAKMFGAEYDKYFVELLKPVLRFAKPGRSSSDKAMAVGIIGEVSKHMGGKVMIKYLPHVMPFVYAGLRTNKVQQNASYCVGVLLSAVGVAAGTPFLAETLKALAPLLKPIDGNLGSVQDNAAAAIARIVMTYGEAVPIGEIVPALIGCVPLNMDHNEDKPVYDCLTGLANGSHASIMPHIPRLTLKFAEAIKDPAVADENKINMVNCIKKLGVSYADQMTKVFATLPTEAQTVLKNAVAALDKATAAGSPATKK